MGHKSSGKSHGSSSHGKSSHGGKSSGGSKRQYTYTTVWYCDNCQNGPLNPNIDAYCTSCGHARCYNCPESTIQVPLGR